MFRFAAAVLVLLGLAFSTCAVAQEFSSLEERMSETDFRGAGLDKLTPEELERLNGWLRSRLNEIPNTVVPQSQVGFKPDDGLFAGGGDRDEIVSRVEGVFDGWNRNTVLKLENGQWWQVTESQSFAVPEMQAPTVTISPAMLGSWLMTVEGYNRSARVTRIR
ncbi:MAG TPA: hypothetical protein VND91_05535 [Candidatus Saccharimonadia bacterium]|nr:hypothetical protein [Candidatus Saccharimonadia bacterium]